MVSETHEVHRAPTVGGDQGCNVMKQAPPVVNVLRKEQVERLDDSDAAEAKGASPDIQNRMSGLARRGAGAWCYSD